MVGEGKTELLGQTLEQLQRLCAAEGFPKYTARQLTDWMYRKRVADIGDMTNLSLKMRARLSEIGQVGLRVPDVSYESSDGTKKYLFRAASSDGEERAVEAVYIPDGERATLCVSCQVGCKMGCKFCYTGRQGFHGHLTAGNILNQVLSIPESGRLTNIVFMGMGEPLDNWEAVRGAVEVLTAEWGLGWSPHRITVSTVGLTPMLRRLLDETQVHVALSLHNAFGAERSELMPMERAYPVAESIRLLRHYDWRGQRRISFEYTMFRGLNDDMRHAAEVVRLLKGLRCRVNLIRFHASPDMPYASSDRKAMEAFEEYLNSHGIICTIRASRGEDIMAACGLLSGRANDGL